MSNVPIREGSSPYIASRASLLLLVGLVVGLANAALDQQQPLEVYSGADAVAGLANSSGPVEMLLMRDRMTLSESDFDGYPLPVVLSRNVTVLGRPDRYAELSMGFVRNKIRFANWVTLTLRHVVFLDFAENSLQAPHLDILLPMLPGEQGLLLMEHAAIISHYCYLFADVFTFEVRPPQIPGTNSGEVTATIPARLRNPTNTGGCVNDTLAPPLDRCWAHVGRYEDYGAESFMMNSMTRVPEPDGYVIHMMDTLAMCEISMDKECVRSYGPLGCSLLVASRNGNSPIPGGSSVPAGGSGGETSGGGGGGMLPIATAGASSGSDAAMEPQPLAIYLGATIGGVLLLAAAAVGVVMLLRRRRQRRLQSTQSYGQSTCVKAEEGQVTDKHWSEVLSSDSADQPCTASGFEKQVTVATSASASQPLPQPSEADQPSPQSLLQQQVVVTSLTPRRPELQVGPKCAEKVEMLSVVLGKGSYGKVYEGVYGGERVAVKVLLDIFDAGASQIRKAAESLAQEVEVLGRCQHPNVVRLLAACLTPPRFCLVMELMETNLHRLIHRNPGQLLPLQTVLYVATDVARALEYLHPTIVHRDLKPANVLINESDGSRPLAKLTDFGLSRLWHTLGSTKHPEAGTPAYTAPECFDPDNWVVSHKADMYSFGTLLWELLTGMVPWKDMPIVAIAFQVTARGKRLPMLPLERRKCPPKLQRLITQCWEKDPMRRPAAAEAVKQLALVQQQVDVLKAMGVPEASWGCPAASWEKVQPLPVLRAMPPVLASRPPPAPYEFPGRTGEEATFEVVNLDALSSKMRYASQVDRVA